MDLSLEGKLNLCKEVSGTEECYSTDTIAIQTSQHSTLIKRNIQQTGFLKENIFDREEK